MDQNEREGYVRTITVLANLLLLSNFLMFRAVVDPERLTLLVQAVAWTIFVAALVAVNCWLYLSYFRKQKTSQSP